MCCIIKELSDFIEMCKGVMFAKISISVFDLIQPIYLEFVIYVMWGVIFFQLSRACQVCSPLRLPRSRVESKHTRCVSCAPSKTEIMLKTSTLLHVGPCSGQASCAKRCQPAACLLPFKEFGE